MKVLGVIARWVFVLCLPLLLLTTSISTAVNSPRCDEPVCLERYEDEVPPLLR